MRLRGIIDEEDSLKEGRKASLTRPESLGAGKISFKSASGWTEKADTDTPLVSLAMKKERRASRKSYGATFWPSSVVGLKVAMTTCQGSNLISSG